MRPCRTAGSRRLDRRRTAGLPDAPDPAAAGCGWPRPSTTWSQVDAEPRPRWYSARTASGFTVRADLEAGQRLLPDQVRGVRVVGATGRPSRSRTRSRRRSRPRSRPAGTGWSRPSGTTSTSSGPAPTSRSTATRPSSRRSGSACSTCCRPVLGPSSGPISAKGLTGDRIRGARLLGHRGVRAASADGHRAARRRPTRSAGGARTLPVALEWARTLRLRGAAFAWRTIHGEECSGYWPAGDGGLPRQRRHRGWRRLGRCAGPATRTSTASARCRCWSRPRGCGTGWATSARTGGSTSTGSPGPTSTARWSTTTPSPT